MLSLPEAESSSLLCARDARAKLAATLVVISAAVLVLQLGSGVRASLLSLGLLQAYVLLLTFLSGVGVRRLMRRVACVLPFGASIALLKPFVEPGEPLLTMHLLRVSREGIEGSLLLLGVLLVTTSSALLFSSTTRVHEVTGALRSLRMPSELVLVLGMSMRFLPLYLRSLREVTLAQRSRCFELRRQRGRQVLQVLAFTVAGVFIRAHSHGRAVYMAMLSRCYTPEAGWCAKRLEPRDMVPVLLSMLVAAFSLLLLTT